MADLISLADAKAALNITTSVHDTELATYIAAATPVIEEIAGPQVASTHTWTTSGGGTLVAVPHSQLTSVTSVTVNGTTLDASEYTVDLVAGIVYAGTRAAPGRFDAGDVVIVYGVGAGAGSNVQMAARELVRFWWQQGQQVSQRPTFGMQDVSEVVASSGYAVPRRVIELLSPNWSAPGLA